jgi:hypothetical protein
MRRVKFVGLVLITTCAMGVSVSQSAAAQAGPNVKATPICIPTIFYTVGTYIYMNFSDCFNSVNGGAGYWYQWVGLEVGVKGHLGEEEVEASGVSTTEESLGMGSFTLTSSPITITCKKEVGTGEVIGGIPAIGTTTATLTECGVQGKTESECHVNSPGKPSGTIATEVNTELVYAGTKTEAEKEEGQLGILLKPKSGSTFVTVEIHGTKCPLFTEGTTEITGSVVADTTSGTFVKTETLSFPATPIKNAYKWESAGKVKLVESSLKIFGIISATESGETLTTLPYLASGGTWAYLAKG